MNYLSNKYPKQDYKSQAKNIFAQQHKCVKNKPNTKRKTVIESQDPEIKLCIQDKQSDG